MTHGKRTVGYFVNWGINGRKFPPTLIPHGLTHLLYAFANLKPDTGEVFLSDHWADKDIHYPGDSWNDTGDNLYGNFKAIYKLKQQHHHHHLKVLLYIGGWTYSPQFHPVVVSPALRAKFVESSIKILEDFGLDGLDIDYEYPSNHAQAVGYTELLKELRHALDNHARLQQLMLPILSSLWEALYLGRERYMESTRGPWGLGSYERLTGRG
ncbi:glycoside hydrolase superfamily [Mycena albidolilacea]|uniref:Glycoside hydrolase superfamily n=1 Tax=Mycena albidolilacea TaxID=1033008 RepID=A0AAD7A0U7_9AGAR|nr:glycoside hydrolase superfamily [Mycena albidolilacea]